MSPYNISMIMVWQESVNETTYVPVSSKAGGHTKALRFVMGGIFDIFN